MEPEGSSKLKRSEHKLRIRDLKALASADLPCPLATHFDLFLKNVVFTNDRANDRTNVSGKTSKACDYSCDAYVHEPKG